VIADRHAAIIEMMAQVVESIPGFKVVGNAREAGAMCDLCRREQPDLVIVDLMMPRSPGPSLLGDLRSACTGARVLVFSGHLRPSLVRGALLSGAHGMVEKSATLEEFRHALRSVGAGQVYFGGASSDEVRSLVNGGAARGVRVARLSEREKSVLSAIADGLSSKEISSRLGISVHTVVHHRSRLMRKTELRSVAHLARYAVQVGLVEETVGWVPAIC
jgi:DNA-binding NarL/FixJ family response regulator